MTSQSTGSGRGVIRDPLLVLVRHGDRDHDWRLAEAKQRLTGWSEYWLVAGTASATAQQGAGGAAPPSPFSTPGLPRVFAMAGRLADELDLEGVQDVSIASSNHSVACDTASVLAHVLRARRIKIVPNKIDRLVLTPPDVRGEANPSFRSASRPEAESETKVKSAASAIEAWRKSQSGPRAALIVVSHQPALTGIALELRVKLPTRTLPLGASEMACFALKKPEDDVPTLEWLLTSTDSAVVGELKEKIKSKIQLAGMLLGAFVVNAGLVINKELWTLQGGTARDLVGCGSLCALVALALTVATLFAYDELLMPTQFWSDGAGRRRRGCARLLDWIDWIAYRQHPKHRAPSWSVPRPPSSDHMLRYFEMIHIWNRLFLPALSCELLSITLFLTATACNGADEWSSNITRRVVGLLCALVLVFLVFRRWRPHVGVND